MSISFIVTSYNVERYITQCLESLRSCVRAGDQVILVDDGSTDNTAEVASLAMSEGWGTEVEWTPVWLGTNTIGGVGIAGNIGLNHATRDTIFFVDGDDYLIPEAFQRARSAYEANPTDICFTDYLEFDDQKQVTKLPADARRWRDLAKPMSIEETRLAALSLIAVPWRKFYRTDFLSEHSIRYPEGDFFFEDNPFHWKVCTLARSISFQAITVCHHRVNRPGQTMASTGLELAAFFDHFRTILEGLPPDRTDFHRQAIRWLINNMAWHVKRLKGSAMYGYARQAEDALSLIDPADWRELSSEFASTSIWNHAEHLRMGGIWDVVEAWKAELHRSDQLALLRRIDKRLSETLHQANTARELLHAQQAAEEFEALRNMIELQDS